LTGYGLGPFAIYRVGKKTGAQSIMICSEEGVRTLDDERIFSPGDMQQGKVFAPFFAWFFDEKLSALVLQGVHNPSKPDLKFHYYCLDLESGALIHKEGLKPWGGLHSRGTLSGLTTNGDQTWVLNSCGWVQEWTPDPDWTEMPSRRSPLDRLFGNLPDAPGTLMSNLRGSQARSACISPRGRIYVFDWWKGAVVSFLPGEGTRFEAQLPVEFCERTLGTPRRLLMPQPKTGLSIDNPFMRFPMAVDAEDNLYLWLAGSLYKYSPAKK